MACAEGKTKFLCNSFQYFSTEYGVLILGISCLANSLSFNTQKQKNFGGPNKCKSARARWRPALVALYQTKDWTRITSRLGPREFEIIGGRLRCADLAMWEFCQIDVSNCDGLSSSGESADSSNSSSNSCSAEARTRKARNGTRPLAGSTVTKQRE